MNSVQAPSSCNGPQLPHPQLNQATAQAVWSLKKEELIEIQTLLNTCQFNTVKEKHVVWFVGNTRRGKSTTINFLAGCKIQSQIIKGRFGKPDEKKLTYDGPWRVKPGEESDGKNRESTTAIPEFIEIDDLLFLFLCDCPGFGDSRGPFQEIKNAIAMHLIAQKAKSLSTVLVVGRDEIDGSQVQGHPLERMCQFVQEGIDVNSALLVITKAEGGEETEMEKEAYYKGKILEELGRDNPHV